MGDRVSIQFINGDNKSVVLFNHWGGTEFPQEALEYVTKLIHENKSKYPNNYSNPLSRLEPDTVMVDFIREITKDLIRVESCLYLGATENDGDNSDNGHWIIDLEEVKLIKPDDYENEDSEEN